MPVRIAVCDDEYIFREKIINSIYSFFGKLDTTCVEFDDGDKLVQAVGNGMEFDAFFLDIEMPVLDGMKTAGKLREMGIGVPIVFLTSHIEFAMDGYEVSAFRFLPKNVSEEKMEKTLQLLKEELCEKQKLIVRCDGENLFLSVDEIVYIEAMNRSVRIVMNDREYSVRMKIGEIEKETAGISDAFARIHRGYIVNMAHVKKQNGNEISVSGGDVLPVSRSVAAEFREKLFEYVRCHSR